jgi:NADH-quinone oxidoreductase subunit H
MLFANDPMLAGDIDLGIVVVVLFKVVLCFAALMIAVMLMIWFERKLISDFQNRVGPNRAGPWGILQTLADGVKVFFKEGSIPDQADRFTFKLAPYLSLVPAFLTFTVLPITGNFAEKDGVISLFQNDTYGQVADPPIAALLILAMSSVAVYGVMLAGWSSGSKYPLLGSVRASAQMVSYEAAMGLSVVTVVLMSGSLSTHDIVVAQAGDGLLGILPNWNVLITGFVPFAIFLIAGTAELNRPPFDLVEAEQELVAGFQTEYGGIRFALFYLAEFMNVIIMSAIMITFFFGGPSGPQLDFLGPVAVLSGFFWFMVKLLCFLFLFVWMRAALPRVRYDQLMDLGWKVLIPLSLGWLLILAAINIGRDEGWNTAIVIGVGIVVFGVCALLFRAAMNTSAHRRALGEEVGV